MTQQQDRGYSERVDAALSELEQLILQQYPETMFHVEPSPEDPEIIHLVATVDVENGYDVLDLVSDRTVDCLIEGLPIFVIPMRPHERTRAPLATSQSQPEALLADELTSSSSPLSS